MVSIFHDSGSKLLLTFAATAAMLTAARAAEPADSGPQSRQSDVKSVDLFDAIHAGQIEVKFIPRNSREANLLVKNNTDQPLTVKLPDAFAATPVLAQAAGNGNANRSTRSNNNNNQNQSVGGGIGGAGGGGIGGGQFSIPAEKTATIKAETVCLEHGKQEPNPHVHYQLEPIGAYTDDAKVQELCKLVGKGEVDQRSAQAAAWHFANQMTWEELAAKKIHHLVGGDEPYFSADEISSAIKIADVAIKAADARASQATAGASKPTTAISNGN